MDELVAALLSELAAPSVRRESQQFVEQLTSRKEEVFRLLAVGRSNAEMAAELIVLEGTARAHASNIYCKLDVASRTQAVARALKLGLLA